MRRNNEIPAKALFLGAAIIFACILIGWGFSVFRKGNASYSNGSNQYSTIMSDYNELDKSIYDGTVVNGSEVIKVIDKISEEENVTVRVTTISNATYESVGGSDVSQKSKVYDAVKYTLTDSKDPNYININAAFEGSISKNENGLISQIHFTQVK